MRNNVSNAVIFILTSLTGDSRLERLGEELGPDSPVWRISNNIARAHDKEFVEGWDKSLDVILILYVFSNTLVQLLITVFCLGESILRCGHCVCDGVVKIAATRLRSNERTSHCTWSTGKRKCGKHIVPLIGRASGANSLLHEITTVEDCQPHVVFCLEFQLELGIDGNVGQAMVACIQPPTPYRAGQSVPRATAEI